MSGLLFGAIAGGMSGAGKAGVAALGELQKYEQNKTLEELRAELMYQKQARLAELTHGFSVELEDKRQTFQSGEAGKEREFRTGLVDKQNENELARLGIQMQDSWARLNFQLKDSALDRASRERVANMQIAASKTQLSTDAEGNIYTVDLNTGKATSVTDAKSGEQLKAKTDLTQSQVQMIGVQKAWAESILKNDLSTPAERQQATEMLTVTLPRMLSGGGNVPSEKNVESLVKNANNPAALLEWDKVWGKKGFPHTAVFAAVEAAKKNAPAAAPATATTPTGADPAPKQPGIVAGAAKPLITPETESLGVKLDAARERAAATEQALQKFGMKQQRDNPQGFATAKEAAAAARRELAEVKKEYETAAEKEVGTLRK
jgi:hypothetical protein